MNPYSEFFIAVIIFIISKRTISLPFKSLTPYFKFLETIFKHKFELF